MSAWFGISLFVAIVAAMAGALWVGRRIEKGKNAKAVSEAQARMADYRDSSDSATTDRMRHGRF